MPFSDLEEHLPKIERTEYHQCAHLHTSKNGYDKYGRQRLRCLMCRKTWTLLENSNSKVVVDQRESRKVAIGRALLVPGATVNQIYKEMKCDSHTVCYLRKLLKGRLPPCPCGLPSGHKGWCSFRSSTYPKQQAYLKSLHDRNKERNKNGPAPGWRLAQNSREETI